MGRRNFFCDSFVQCAFNLCLVIFVLNKGRSSCWTIAITPKLSVSRIDECPKKGVMGQRHVSLGHRMHLTLNFTDLEVAAHVHLLSLKLLPVTFTDPDAAANFHSLTLRLLHMYIYWPWECCPLPVEGIWGLLFSHSATLPAFHERRLNLCIVFPVPPRPCSSPKRWSRDRRRININ